MPELTVSMPARNVERFIGEAISSVLGQSDVDLELIVVDDASDDRTAAVVESFRDARVRLVRNATGRGIASCHNIVLDLSRAPVIAHVDADDVLLPGALRRMIATLRSDPRLGQVHCHYFFIGEDGSTTRGEFQALRRALLGLHRPGMDYKRELVVHGMVANCLRTYRREVFETVGRFDERLVIGEDHDMALRIVDKYHIAVVPAFLYGVRLHPGSVTQNRRLPFLQSWWQRLRQLRRLKRSGEVRFLHQKAYRIERLMLRGLAHVLHVPEAVLRTRNWVRWQLGKDGLAGRTVGRVAEHLYYAAVERLSWWPLDWTGRRRSPPPAPGTRIAWYLWRFPLLSETFIRREITALAARGFDVRVLADGPADVTFADADARALLASTAHLDPLDEERFLAYRRYFLRRHPLRYLNVALYTVFHRYDYWKTLSEDHEVFKRAIYLAGMMRDAKIGRVHSPWADRSAFVALLAARLLNVPCSIQARAHELHRTAHRYALREKFSGADLVVTNCRYNEAHIRALMPPFTHLNLHTIYEGVDLDRFARARTHWDLAGPLQVLCVARLIEEKGLEYLLRACAMLRDDGVAFQCDVIGGVEVPLYADYLVRLKKLHRALRLGSVVRFHGAQPFGEVMRAYERADVFVLPCVVAANGGRDITPNSLIEAMAMRLPVVSTRLAAIPEIVEDGVSGLLVPPNDAEALHAAIVRLAHDSELREQLGRQARRRIEDRFDLGRTMEQFAAALGGPAA